MRDECRICDDGPAQFFNWHCPSCRARWLYTLPTKAWRQQAINEWRKAGEVEMVAAVIALLREMQPTKPSEHARKGT
jgi:hypothetical protein